jgi:hypothetical protein
MFSVAFVFVAVVMSDYGVNGQAALQVTYVYKNANGSDVSSTEVPISSTIVFNNLACMHMCTLSSNCALAAFKVTNSNCSLYATGTKGKVVASAASILYQKQINGYTLFVIFKDLSRRKLT